jgi:hypothetical protein
MATAHLPTSAKVGLRTQGFAGRRVEQLLLHGDVRSKIARELWQERRAHAGAPALHSVAELLEVPVLVLHQCRGFHGVPEGSHIVTLARWDAIVGG